MQVLLYSANVFGAAGTARDVDTACVSSFRAKHGQAQDLQHLQQKHIGSWHLTCQVMLALAEDDERYIMCRSDKLRDPHLIQNESERLI